MIRLRRDKVIVELIPDKKEKDNYKEVAGILVPVQQEEKGELTECIIKQIGHEVDPKDVPVGVVAYVRIHQGDRLYPTKLEYIFRADDIIGHD